MYARSVTVGILLATFVMQIHASQKNLEEKVDMQNPLTYDRRTQAMDAVFFKMGISYDRDIRNLLLKTEESMHGLGFPLDVAQIVGKIDVGAPVKIKGLIGSFLYPHLTTKQMAKLNGKTGIVEKQHGPGKWYVRIDGDTKSTNSPTCVFTEGKLELLGKSEPDVRMFEPKKLWYCESAEQCKILFEDKTNPQIALRLVVNSDTMFWELIQYKVYRQGFGISQILRQGLPDARKIKEVYKSFSETFGEKVRWEKTSDDILKTPETMSAIDRAAILYGDRDFATVTATVTHTCGNDDMKLKIMKYMDQQKKRHNLRFPVAGRGSMYWKPKSKTPPVPPTASVRKH